MLEYQNLFTRVQVRTVPEAGIPIEDSPGGRLGTGAFSYLAGKFGDAQIGPIYLGTAGTFSLLFGFLAFEIIGLNMWASVGWDPVEFIRQLPWLALEPPPPQYGLHIPPLQQGGRSSGRRRRRRRRRQRHRRQCRRRRLRLRRRRRRKPPPRRRQ